jgi:hypothetical protein
MFLPWIYHSLKTRIQLGIFWFFSTSVQDKSERNEADTLDVHIRTSSYAVWISAILVDDSHLPRLPLPIGVSQHSQYIVQTVANYSAKQIIHIPFVYN